MADDDREDLIHVLGTVVERYSWRCYAYCLMTNQYHLLIETPTANLSRGMRQMNGLYTQRFNRRHARVVPQHGELSVAGTANGTVPAGNAAYLGAGAANSVATALQVGLAFEAGVLLGSTAEASFCSLTCK